MKKPTIVLVIDDNQLLLEVNKLADKYNMSGYTCVKLAAWCRMESGRKILGNNPGNVRPGQGQDYYVHPGAVDEFVNGEHVVASGADDPLRRFRSFETLTDGIEAMILWLVKNHKKAWETLNNDDCSISEFGMSLGQKDDRGLHYYTAKSVVYTSALLNCYRSRFEKFAT